MSRNLLICLPWYRPEDYASILEIMDDAESLPVDYDEWLQLALNLERKLMGQDMKVIHVLVDPAAFPQWCAERGLRPVAASRSRFASEEAPKPTS